jgi:hypothetical protein
MSNTMDYERHQNGAWGPPAGQHGPRWHPLGILVMVLGFVFWWPVGLAILFYMLWSRSMCGYGDRFENKMQRMQAKMDRFRSRMGEGFPRWDGPSTGNRAFDEYRSETLKRLEDEQREFKDFLYRLRHAKDKSEFDQFMSERRNRPSSPPQDDRPAA